MQQLYGENFEFLQNDCIMAGDTAICGTRGWVLPSSENFTAEDEKIYKREAIRLEMSLKAAAKQNPASIIVAMHYPPLFAGSFNYDILEILYRYNIRECWYGHIHGRRGHELCVQGVYDDVDFHLISGDYLQFIPRKVR